MRACEPVRMRAGDRNVSVQRGHDERPAHRRRRHPACGRRTGGRATRHDPWSRGHGAGANRGLPDETQASSRMPRPAHATCAATTPAALERAAVAFTGKALCAVVHASTTTGYVLGRREESELVERLAQRFDLPAVASCATAAAALRTRDLEKVPLVHPPRFTHEFHELGEAYFRSHGFDAVVTKAGALPENPATSTHSLSSTGSSTMSTTEQRRSFSPAPGSQPRERSRNWSCAPGGWSSRPTECCCGRS